MFKWFMLAVYLLLILYVVLRGLHCIRKIHQVIDHRRVWIPLTVLFLLGCSTLLLGGLLPYGPVRISLHKFSNYWLGLFIYLVFFTLLADILRAILCLINRWKKIAILGTPKGCGIMFLAVVALSAIFTVYGIIHADHIYTNSYEVTVNKDAGDMEELNIVLIADLHLGYSVGIKDMQQMVEKVNALDADLIVIAGDIVDNEYDSLADPDGIAEVLRQMKSKYGVYAVYGNHDVAETLIGGFSITPKSQAFRDPRVEEFMEKCGFIMLTDESVLIEDSFYLVGRLDGEKAGDGTDNRTASEELIEDLDQSKPVILVCHEPDELHENAKAGYDMQLSGHTHAGQFFPVNLPSPFVFENYWGYLLVEDSMHSFVTSGVGIYGPDIRVMTDSEVMQIKVDFQK